MRILAVNPGSTSTKIGLFEGDELRFQENVRHGAEELKRFPEIFDQISLRTEAVLAFLASRQISLDSIEGFVGRGGPIRPLDSGTYLVDAAMEKALMSEYRVAHVSLLGGLIARALARSVGREAYIVDPVSVDELEPVARFSGHPDYERISLAHALNLKAAARKAAAQLGRPYDELRLVVVHMGSGTSVSAHAGGRMIDVENPADEGPFSMDRTGSLPLGALLKQACSGKFSEKELKTRYTKEGGVFAYLNILDAREAEARMDAGDEKVRAVFEALVYQTAKAIGAYATVLEGRLDAIVLTGGLAWWSWVTENLRRRIDFLGTVLVIPGEDELEALAAGCARVLSGRETARSLN